MHQFRQVDVFGSGPLTGNPVAVVHDADDLDDERMQLFAQWTNLSETTFLLRPTDPAADYRLRIFTASRELPFAGHPTLGSAHAWLEAGGAPRGEHVVQECGAGLVEVRARRAARVRGAAAARDGPVDEGDLTPSRTSSASAAPTSSTPSGSTTAPAGSACCSRTRTTCSTLEPDRSKLDGWDIGVVGPWRDGAATIRGRGRRGARVRLLHRGPGDRQPQRQPRPVAGRDGPARAVRRGAGHRHRPARPGARAGGRERRSGWAGTPGRRSAARSSSDPPPGSAQGRAASVARPVAPRPESRTCASTSPPPGGRPVRRPPRSRARRLR